MPVRNRYAQLSPAQRRRHGIAEPVCLYTPDELVELVEAAGFRVRQVWTSDFGNVKLVGHLEEREDDGGT